MTLYYLIRIFVVIADIKRFFQCAEVSKRDDEIARESIVAGTARAQAYSSVSGFWLTYLCNISFTRYSFGKYHRTRFIYVLRQLF